MRILTDRKALATALVLAKRAAGSSTLPVVLSADDGAFTLRAIHPELELVQVVGARVELPGTAAVALPDLIAAVKSFVAYSYITIELNEVGHLWLHAEAVEATLVTAREPDGSPAAPPVIEPPQGAQWTVDGARLGAVVNRITPSTSADPARVGLHDLHFEAAPDAQSDSRVVATDGTRLQYAMLGAPIPASISLPRHAALALGAWLPSGEITVTSDEVHTRWKSAEGWCTTLRNDPRMFPDYRMVVDWDRLPCLRVSREAIMAAAKRCGQFASDRNRVTHMEVRDDRLVLSCARDIGSDRLREEVPCEVRNAGLVRPWELMGINAQILGSILETTQVDDIDFQQHDPVGPLCWATGDGHAIVMSVRIN